MDFLDLIYGGMVHGYEVAVRQCPQDTRDFMDFINFIDFMNLL